MLLKHLIAVFLQSFKRLPTCIKYAEKLGFRVVALILISLSLNLPLQLLMQLVTLLMKVLMKMPLMIS